MNTLLEKTIIRSHVFPFIDTLISLFHYGDVCNISGGHDNHFSILQPLKIAESFKSKIQHNQSIDQNNASEPISYISGLNRMQTDYPNWDNTNSLQKTIRQIVEAIGLPRDMV